MMGGGVRSRRRRPPFRRTELLVFSVACLPFFRNSPAAVAAALMINPHPFLPKTGLASAFSRVPLRADTKLKTNYADDDFASFSDFDDGGDGQQMAREFYQELQQRQMPSPDADRGRNDASGNTIRTVRISADGNMPSSRRFTKQQTTKASTPSGDAFPLSLFPFFSVPAPAPTSAGLFSGSGTTVYSSGRSIRAEMDILETTIKNSEAKNNKKLGDWDGIYVASPEQLEEVLRLIALSLLVASAAYIAIEASGGIAIITWDDAASSANHVMSLMSDVTKDGMSSIMVSVNHGDVFMGEEAAWLWKESTDLAATMKEAVRSMEDLVLS